MTNEMDSSTKKVQMLLSVTLISLCFFRFLGLFGSLLFFDFHFEIVLTEGDQVIWVLSDHFFAVVFQDAG